MAFTYIRPLLTVEGQINGQQLSGILLIYGLAGIAGNFVLGLCASRWLTSTIITIILGICASLTIFILLPINSITGSITMLLWGFMYGGVSVVLMTWMIIHSHKYIEITSSLYIAFFNLGIAAGSTLGGFTVALSDFYTNLSIALLLLLATLILLLSYRKG
nr:MFS transporter [Providencia stuartii]ELR5080462.1 MFS transporter [Providencia stuartii]